MSDEILSLIYTFSKKFSDPETNLSFDPKNQNISAVVKDGNVNICTKTNNNNKRFKIDAKNILAIASGKGGVGKSTFSVNLATALSSLNLKIGLLDADIYGPSIPRMMGISKKPIMNENKKLVPLENYGIKLMSIGFILDSEAPTIWRGPMVMKALASRCCSN